MISITLAIPSTGKGLSLKRQISLLEKVPWSLAIDFEIKVEVIITLNCPEQLVPQYILGTSANLFPGVPLTIVCNKSNLGFDMNILKCISISQGQYIHFLSDNDYFPPSYFVKLFETLACIRSSCQYASPYPDQILPLTMWHKTASLPDWHKPIIEKLFLHANKYEIFSTINHVEQSCLILLSSQISTCIIRNNEVLHRLTQDLILNTNPNKPYALGGIAHSVYLWSLLGLKQYQSFNTPARLICMPFFWTGNSISCPTITRSRWFYESTLLEAPSVYNNLDPTVQSILKVDCSVLPKQYALKIAEYIRSIGISLFLQDSWRYTGIRSLNHFCDKRNYITLIFKFMRSCLTFCSSYARFLYQYYNMVNR